MSITLPWCYPAMRAATKTDARAMAALDMQLFPNNCFGAWTLTQELQAGAGLVIYNSGQLIGYALIRWDHECVDITRLGVHPDYQNRGYGTELLRGALSQYYLPAILCVEKENERALKLYLQHGFEIVGQLCQSWVMKRPTSPLL